MRFLSRNSVRRVRSSTPSSSKAQIAAASANAVEALEGRVLFDGTYHSLSGGQFAQNWTNTTLITTDNVWTGVPSIIGYSGIGTTSGTDPRNLTTQTATNVRVIANLTDTANNSGGAKEFEIPNPTIGLAGSNTSTTGGSPYIQLHLNSTGVSSVDVAYNVRDLEATADDAVQQVDLQYRAGTTGNWTSVPAAFVADATNAVTDTKVTPVSVTLPANAGNQSQLQVRIITGNASGNDENVGIDDIVVKATPVVQPPGSFNLSDVRANEGAGTATVTVARTGGTGGAATVQYATSNDTATAGADYTAASGTLNFADGQASRTFTVPLTDDATDEIAERFNVALSNATGATLGFNTTATVTIVDNDAAPLASGPFTQDWSDTDQITVDNNWDGVLNIVGYASDLGRDDGVVDVEANESSPTFNTGGVTEFELENPAVGLAGSGTGASAPQLVIDVNTTGVAAAEVSFNARDLDPSADDAVQGITIAYRVGSSGDFNELLFDEDVTLADATPSTPLSVLLPADALGQPLVQVRVATQDAGGNDEAVGIDDIYIGAPQSNPGTLAFSAATARAGESAGTATVTVSRNGGTSGAVTVNYATADLTATAGADYVATSGSLTFADGVATQDIVVPISPDAIDELGEAFSITLSGATGGAAVGEIPAISVTIADDDGQVLSAGPLVQNWSNTDLIAANDNWDGVSNISGFLTDADRDNGVVDVIANQSNPNISNGGVAEFDGIADPTVAFQGSAAASEPQLLLDVNTTGVANATVSFNARDIDATTDNAIQPVSVSYRIGNAGDFIEFFSIEDATTGPSLADAVTPVSVALPAGAIGQGLVQVRIATTNATGVSNNNDEFVGIDDISISAGVVASPGTIALTSPTYSVAEEGGSATISVARTGGTAGTVTVDYATAAGTAQAGSDFTAANGTLTFLDGASTATFVVPIVDDSAAEPSELFTVSLSTVTGGATLGTPASADVTITDADVAPVAATVVGRRVFYNNSAFDGNSAAANAADDGAIATDKTALLPGGTATFANYTSYTKGINGVMIDVANLAGTTVTAADFTLQVGNDSNPATFTAAPAPTAITVRPGAGVGGSSRVTLTFADGSILKKYLRVTLLANANTGLATSDVFYFGNAVGDTGDAANATVTPNDEIGARNNPRNNFNPAPITFAYDFDRDRNVNPADQLVARNNGTNTFNDLNLIAPPALTGGFTFTATSNASSAEKEKKDASAATPISDLLKSI